MNVSTPAVSKSKARAAPPSEAVAAADGARRAVDRVVGPVKVMPPTTTLAVGPWSMTRKLLPPLRAVEPDCETPVDAPDAARVVASTIPPFAALEKTVLVVRTFSPFKTYDSVVVATAVASVLPPLAAGVVNDASDKSDVTALLIEAPRLVIPPSPPLMPAICASTANGRNAMIERHFILCLPFPWCV